MSSDSLIIIAPAFAGFLIGLGAPWSFVRPLAWCVGATFAIALFILFADIAQAQGLLDCYPDCTAFQDILAWTLPVTLATEIALGLGRLVIAFRGD